MTGPYKMVGRDFYKAVGYILTLSQIRNLKQINCHRSDPTEITTSTHFHQQKTLKMMKTLVSLLLLIAPVVAASGLRGPQDDDAIFCHLFVATGSEAEDHGDETLVKYQCLFDDNESRRNKYEIDLPESFLKEHLRIIMQNPVLRIPGGTVTKHSVHVPENAAITVHAETSPRRRLAPKSGTPKTLTVRVIANGNSQPQNSKSQLQGRVFGVGGDAEDNTVFTQYKKCSFGAQDIQPATSGNGMQSGVVDVNAPIDIA